MARLKDIAKAYIDNPGIFLAKITNLEGFCNADGFEISVKPASEPASNGREAMHYTVSSA
jgi:hypothetical protein